MKGRKAEVSALEGALSSPPKCPPWLPKHAKTEWRRVVPGLVARRALAVHELQTVEGYCLAVARIREAEEIIAAEGLTFTNERGEPKRRPETTILKENIEAARRLAAELGLTPASRGKNKGGVPGDGEDNEFGVDL